MAHVARCTCRQCMVTIKAWRTDLRVAALSPLVFLQQRQVEVRLCTLRNRRHWALHTYKNTMEDTVSKLAKKGHTRHDGEYRQGKEGQELIFAERDGRGMVADHLARLVLADLQLLGTRAAENEGDGQDGQHQHRHCRCHQHPLHVCTRHRQANHDLSQFFKYSRSYLTLEPQWSTSAHTCWQ